MAHDRLPVPDGLVDDLAAAVARSRCGAFPCPDLWCQRAGEALVDHADWVRSGRPLWRGPVVAYALARELPALAVLDRAAGDATEPVAETAAAWLAYVELASRAGLGPPAPSSSMCV